MPFVRPAPTVAVLFLFAALTVMSPPVFAAADPNPPSIQSNRGAWPLYRQWTPAEVEHFGKFIAHIWQVKNTGTLEQRRAKIEAVLTDPEMNLLLDPEFAGETVNPQIDRASMQAMHTILDCGKLTIALTGYYAYRRGLPWMIGRISSGDGTDIRTSAFNIARPPLSSLDYASPLAFFNDAITSFCTGNYRIEPGQPYSELSDTVPVVIDREHLASGSMFYLDGHVMFVAKVDEFGDVHFLDSTTSPSRDIYTHHGMNAVMGVSPRKSGSERPFAGCYRGFRVHRWPIAEVDEEGNVLNVRRRTDAEMAQFGYSTEQYDVIEDIMARGRYSEGDIRTSSFHDFLRLRLRTVERYQPAAVLAHYADEWLDLFKDREDYVQAAWEDVQRNGPIVFPEAYPATHLFNAPGRWGQWSTAAIDVDCRAHYFNMLNWVQMALERFEAAPEEFDLGGINGNPNAIWTRADLALALRAYKDRLFAARSFSYTNSNGEKVSLTLRDMEHRLFDFSFDPNHPPELRWGAEVLSAEAGNMPQMATPLPTGDPIPMAEAYARQAYYRTLTHWDTEQSYLREMFTEGFPVQARFDGRAATWTSQPSPPIVPRGARNNWSATPVAAGGD